MSIGPFDAVTNRAPLDQFVIGAAPPSRAGERGSEFADHLQSPAQPEALRAEERKPLGNTPENRTQRSESPRESSSAKSESAKTEPDKAESVSTKQSSDNPEDETTKTTDDSTDSQQSQQEAARAEATKPETSQDNEEDHDDAPDITDELLIQTAAATVAQAAVVERQVAAKSAPTEAVDEVDSPANESPAVTKEAPTATDTNPKDQLEAKVGNASIDASVSTKVDANADDTNVVVQANSEVPLPDVPTDAIADEGELVVQTQLHSSAYEKLSRKTQADDEAHDEKAVTEEKGVAVQSDTLEQKVDAKGRDTKRDRAKSTEKGEHGAKELQANSNDLQDAAPQANPVNNAPTVTETASASADLAASIDTSAVATSTATNAPAPHGSTENVTATSRLPEHLLARATSRGSNGSQGSGGPAVTTAEQARLIQRVAKAFQAAQSRGGELRLRLSPPELGALRLEVKLQSGVMTARLEAESPAAKTVLLDNLPALKDRLAEQGIQVERFDVDLMDRQPTGQQNSPQDQQQRSSPRAPIRNYVNNSRTADDIATSDSPPRARPTDGRLNVTI